LVVSASVKRGTMVLTVHWHKTHSYQPKTVLKPVSWPAPKSAVMENASANEKFVGSARSPRISSTSKRLNTNASVRRAGVASSAASHSRIALRPASTQRVFVVLTAQPPCPRRVQYSTTSLVLVRSMEPVGQMVFVCAIHHTVGKTAVWQDAPTTAAGMGTAKRSYSNACALPDGLVAAVRTTSVNKAMFLRFHVTGI